MRKIEFRGKRIDNGEWVYEYYSMCVERWDNGGVEVYYREGCTEIHYISNSNGDLFIVDPETVGQYTGLKDKNGIDIYEGDILKLWRSVGQNGALRGEHIPLEVVYCNQWCQFVVLNKSCKEQFGIWQQFGAFEVVGNIHDNPELLEV